MDDIVGARYWYNPTKQYGYELVSFKIDKFWNEETGEPVYKPYVDVFLEESKIQKKKNYTSVEGYLDEEFFMERWTGAEDSYGEKIYEGDIIEIRGMGVIKTGVVRYGKIYPREDWLDKFYLEYNGKNFEFDDFDSYYIETTDITVVGNVNEDPEFYEQIK